MAPPLAIWHQFANGDLWELYRGVDYPTLTANAINACRTWGSRNGYRVSISEVTFDSFRVRMTPKVTVVARG